MKNFAKYIVAFSFIAAIGVIFFVSDPVAALSVYDGVNAARGDQVPGTLFGGGGAGGFISTLVNILLFIVGALSVIMLIIGGMRYAISSGNSSSVTAAKNTVLYAIVGLVVSLLAFAVINFIMSVLGGGMSLGGFGGQAGWTDV